MATPSTTKPLRRHDALAFIIERIGRTGISPTLDEIGQHLKVSKPRARELVDELVDRGMLERRVGLQRNLVVRDLAGCRLVLEDVLRRLGWPVAKPMGELSGTLPHVQLPLLPPFEHLPDVD